MIASAGISILSLALIKSEVGIQSIKLSDINLISAILVAAGVFALKKYKANPIHVMLVSGIIGIVIYSII